MKPESLPRLGLKGAQLLRFLVGEIARGNIRKGEPETFVTYSEVLRGLGITEIHHAGQQLNLEGLIELNDWTMSDPELPRIVALIVDQDTPRPSASFLKSHDAEIDDWQWWMEEANKAIDFDWSPFLEQSVAPAIEEPTARLREGEEELPDYWSVVTLEPPPAHIRKTQVTVGEILRRLATGQSEAEILSAHTELRAADIRASLAYAAEREKQAAKAELEPSRLSSFASKWQGQFFLPKSDPDDPRRDYLLKKYWRNRA